MSSQTLFLMKLALLVTGLLALQATEYCDTQFMKNCVEVVPIFPQDDWIQRFRRSCKVAASVPPVTHTTCTANPKALLRS